MPRGKQRVEKVVKTTVELPASLWREVKIRAVDDQSDLRDIIIKALYAYLKKKGAREEG
jgi:hypothetical protein